MAGNRERVFNELVESFVERYRRGERPSLSELTRKHPEYSVQIEKFFPSLVLMEELGPGDDDSLTVPRAAAIPGLDNLDDYEILREVGRGGMGVVYEAKQESLNRHVALKVLPFHGLMDSNHLKRFQREARAAARLHHTNIVPVFEVGEHEGIHYYAMQFIRGQALDEVLSDLIAIRGELRSSSGTSTTNVSVVESPVTHETDCGSSPDPSSPPASANLSGRSALSDSTTSDQHYFRRVASIGVQAADALSYAHHEGILHRDVKPSNLMLDTEGKVWVTDFGLAKTDAKEDLTHTGDLVGTLRYMAPERFDGWSDPRSDIYGLGLTLYEMLTLQSAFAESERARLIKRITNHDLPRPRRADRNIPADLETIVLKSIAKDPGERYQSALQMADDLRRFLNRVPIEARRTPLAERARMWCRRNPLVASLTIAIAGLLMVVAAGATLSTIWLRGERNQALSNLGRAETAEQAANGLAEREREARVAAQRSLYAARLAQARAGRWSGQMGRRFEGLDAIAEAARLAHELNLGEDALLLLRNEAIACMALVDFRVDRSWPLDGARINRTIAFDVGIERYARLEPGGDFVIRRMSDNAEIVKLPGFGDMTIGGLFMQFSPDGRRFAAKMAVSNTDFQVVAWDLMTTREVFRTSVGGRTFYSNVDFSPDGDRLTFYSNSGSLCVHHFTTGETVELIEHLRPVIWIRCSPDGRQLAVVPEGSGPGRGRVLIIDLDRGAVIQTLELERPTIMASWGRESRTLAIPNRDGSVDLWEVATGQHRQISGKHGDAAAHAEMNPAGDLLVSMAREPSNRVWDPRTCKPLLETEQALISFSRDGRWLSSEEMHPPAAVRLEVAAPRECRMLVGHSPDAGVVDVSFSPDGKLLASATKRDGIRIWDVATARELAVIEADPPRHVGAFDDSGQYFVTVGRDIEVWPITIDSQGPGRAVVRIGPPELANRTSHTPPVDKSRLIAVPSSLGEVLLVSLGDRQGHSVVHTERGGRTVTLSPDGKWFATGDRNRPTIEIYDSATRTLEKRFAARLGSVVQFSPDGKWLVGSLAAGSIVFWQAGSWQESHRVHLDGRGFSRMAFSRDGRLVAVTDSFHVTLYDASDGREIARISAPNRERLGQVVADSASGIAFSPDGNLLAVGTRDGPVQLWDLRLIRGKLAEMNLDWEPSPFSPTSEGGRSSATAGTSATVEKPIDPIALRVEILGNESINHLADLARLNDALQRDPNNLNALLARARIYWAQRRYEAMMADARRMIELRPDEHHGYAWRAFPLMMLGHYEEAIADFHRALELNATNAWPMRHLAWMHLTGPENVRDDKQARELAEKAVQLKASPLFVATLGGVCFRQGDFPAAIRHLEIAATAATDDDSQCVRLFFLAMTQHRLGQLAEARQSYDAALGWLDTPITLGYFRRDEIERLRDEAEAMIFDDRE